MAERSQKNGIDKVCKKTTFGESLPAVPLYRLYATPRSSNGFWRNLVQTFPAGPCPSTGSLHIRRLVHPTQDPLACLSMTVPMVVQW